MVGLTQVGIIDISFISSWMVGLTQVEIMILVYMYVYECVVLDSFIFVCKKSYVDVYT